MKTTSNRKERLVESTSADVVYSCSGGKLLPGKHLSLAIGLKSRSGSKKIVRSGHCASNENVRRVDIGLESTITENSELLPEGIKTVTTKPLGMGLAWDNFDINLETLSWANSIHHTCGICYQEIQEDTAQQDNSEAAVSGSRKHRIKDISRINESKEQDDVPSYIKKPRMNKFEFENTCVFPNESLVKATDLDNIWEILINNFDGIPLWSGWNSRWVKQSKTTHHKVCYMTSIPFLPTRIDVIKEVMVKSEEVRVECGEMVLPVCFDLAIAKIAPQIPCQEAPEYDNLFILFGQFHLELNVFSALGKLIEGSGGPCVLSEAGVISAGSINKFLKGKMYNRCRRGSGYSNKRYSFSTVCEAAQCELIEIIEIERVE